MAINAAPHSASVTPMPPAVALTALSQPPHPCNSICSFCKGSANSNAYSICLSAPAVCSVHTCNNRFLPSNFKSPRANETDGSSATVTDNCESERDMRTEFAENALNRKPVP